MCTLPYKGNIVALEEDCGRSTVLRTCCSVLFRVSVRGKALQVKKKALFYGFFTGDKKGSRVSLKHRGKAVRVTVRKKNENLGKMSVLLLRMVFLCVFLLFV